MNIIKTYKSYKDKENETQIRSDALRMVYSVIMDRCLGATAYIGLHPVCLPRPWAHHGNKA